MSKIDPINLSPSFLSRLLSKGYDYAVAEKLGLISKDTASMSAGRALHSFLSAAYGGKQDEIAISPYDSFRTKEARDWRDSQPDNVTIIKQEEAELYAELVKRVQNHPALKEILDGYKLEAEKTVTKEVNGMTVKGVLDLVGKSEHSTIVIDWKFVGSQVFDDFARKSLWSHYDLQGSVYDFLTDATNIYFCVIENEAPHRIQIFHCDLSYLESGGDKFDKALKIIKAEDWRQPSFDIAEVGELISWNHYNG